ncbi:hypothetical protein ACHAXS_008007, partial [Conticribra weissflogii]
SISGDAERANEVENLQDELVKYTNRYKLLEKALEGKVRELKTMSNRAKLLEDAVARVQNKVKKEHDDGNDQFGIFKQQSEQKIANLTHVIQSLVDEKGILESETKALVTQQIRLEREYNTTIGGLRNRVNSLETAIEDLLRGQDERDLRYAEIKNSKAQLEETIQKQNETIGELQDQLATLLDAYSELEQLNNESEELVQNYKLQIKEAQEVYETAMKLEQDTKQQYESRLSESKQRLEKQRDTFREELEASKKEYERLLEQEREKMTGLTLELESLRELQARTIEPSISNTTHVSANGTSTSGQDWSDVELELERAKSEAASYKTKVGDMEAQLQKLREESEAQKKEQHEHLKALQGQLLSFNQTIQKQHYQIEKYQEQVNFLKKEHQESMLIAKSSVDASQKREGELLRNIEELERELSLAQREKNEFTIKLDESKELFQKKIDDEKLDAVKLVQKNTEYELLIAQLNDKIKVLINENDRSSVQDKEEEGRKGVDSLEAISLVSRDEELQSKTGKEPRKRTWRRVLFRPWTLLRRQRE